MSVRRGAKNSSGEGEKDGGKCGSEGSRWGREGRRGVRGERQTDGRKVPLRGGKDAEEEYPAYSGVLWEQL